MSSDIARVSVSAPIQHVLKALDEDGVVIVEDLLDKDTLTRLNADLDPLLAGPPVARRYLNTALEGFWVRTPATSPGSSRSLGSLRPR
jgi:hypothetical protein